MWQLWFSCKGVDAALYNGEECVCITLPHGLCCKQSLEVVLDGTSKIPQFPAPARCP